MKCRTIRELLPLYVSGDLPVRSQRRVGHHVEACDSCRAEFEAFCRVRLELNAYRDCVDSEVEFATEALADIVGREIAGTPPGGRTRGRLVRGIRRLSPVAAVALIAVGTAVLWPSSGPVDRGRSARQSTMPPDLALRKLDEEPPVPYTNPGRLHAPADFGGENICIIAGPGMSLRVAVPGHAPELPMAPRPRVRPHGYRSSAPISPGSVTH